MTTLLYSGLSEEDLKGVPLEKIREARDQELEFLGIAKTTHPGAIRVVNFNNIMESDGTYYPILDFLVEARWLDTSGDLWLRGAGFTVNLTVLTRERVTIFDKLLAAS
jgi:hypothetical protein